uniref:G-protein coupled receptors family 1 profile domain-containing protein n=1 Tax=Neogobius melanostomus TaxID=47308 RepID=A0A8C6S552_9GOBI
MEGLTNQTNFCDNLKNTSADFRTLIVGFFLVTIAVITMCGNLLVIFSIIYFRQLHTPTNYLILSLAATDLLVGAVIIQFSTVLLANPCWNLQNPCFPRQLFDLALCSCSILNLCFISIDRYYAVCQPLSYKTKINANVTSAMILIAWTVSFGSATVMTLGGPNRNRGCVLFHAAYLASVATVFTFYTPSLIMITIYLNIFYVAKKQARSIHSKQPGATVSRSEKKATRTLAIVMGAFVFCWSPLCMCVTFLPVKGFKMPVTALEILKWIAWSNSMLNPFIYAYFYSWFRCAFRIILSGKIFQGNYTNAKLH